MKVSKVLAALISAVTLSSATGITAFAAENENNRTNGDFKYVALGDSIAAGFGLAGGDLTQDPALIITDELLADPVKGAYPAIFTEYIDKLGEERGYNVKGTNLASTAYRAEDIENTIKTPGYKGAFASSILEAYLGEGSSDVLIPYHDTYTKYLTEADLVSIQLGGNDIIMSIVPQMVGSENPVLKAAGISLMLTLFGTDTKTAIGGGLQVIAESKDSITSEDFLEAASFMYNIGARADALVDESANHVKGVVEAVKELNSDADIALVGMYNPYRTPEESEEIKEDIFAVLGKVYAAAANAAAESEDELTAGGKQSIDYINGLKDKVAKINEIKSVMEKYNDAAELQELLAMIAEYDDINEVKTLAELVSSSEGKPENQELMDIMLSYDDISELQAVIDIIRNYDDISELTELMAVMTKYRTANQTAVANAIASEVAAPLAMKATGKNVDPQMRRLNEKLMDVAEETGAVYVDVYGISPEDDFDPHPNANGHKEIAEILYDTMSERITERMKVEEKPEAPETTEETLPAEETAACNFRIVGDVNGDGMINSADAAYILAHSSGLVQLSDDDKKYADIDGNKRVDIIDAILLMSCIDRYNSMYFNRFNGRNYNYFPVYGIRSTPMNHFGRMNGFGVRFR